jgi:hypothetical protein
MIVISLNGILKVLSSLRVKLRRGRLITLIVQSPNQKAHLPSHNIKSAIVFCLAMFVSRSAKQEFIFSAAGSLGNILRFRLPRRPNGSP